MQAQNSAVAYRHQSLLWALQNHLLDAYCPLEVVSHTLGYFFPVFTVYHVHYSAAAKLTLAFISISSFFLLTSEFTLITGILNFLLSNSIFFRCYFFGLVVHLSFLILKLNLLLVKVILCIRIMAVSWKRFFLHKAEAKGCCMKLALGAAVLAVATWSIACIWQPNASFSYKCSNFQGNGIYPDCPGP